MQIRSNVKYARLASPGALLPWLFAATMAGCASAAVPTAEHARGIAAIRAAQELGAAGVPAAALHLQMAEQGVEQASHLMQNGDNHGATFALMRAEADAELAQALAREAPARAQAHDALDKVQSTLQENAQ
jgi:uncharacterized protein YqfA (UPF0365 family)